MFLITGHRPTPRLILDELGFAQDMLSQRHAFPRPARDKFRITPHECLHCPLHAGQVGAETAPPVLHQFFAKDSPASAYFPTDMHPSIIGAGQLNDSVRDGKRCDLTA